MATTPALVSDLQDCIQTFLDLLSRSDIIIALSSLDSATTTDLTKVKNKAQLLLGTSIKNWTYWTPNPNVLFPIELGAHDKLEIELENGEVFVARASNINWQNVDAAVPGRTVFRYRKL